MVFGTREVMVSFYHILVMLLMGHVMFTLLGGAVLLLMRTSAVEEPGTVCLAWRSSASRLS